MPLDPWDGRSQLDVDVLRIGEVAIAEVTGEIDLMTADGLRSHLVGALATMPGVLIVDLTAVGFMASTGLQVLLDVHAAAGAAIAVVVVAIGPVTARPIEITGIDDVIPLYRTRHEALRRWNR